MADSISWERVWGIVASAARRAGRSLGRQDGWPLGLNQALLAFWNEYYLSKVECAGSGTVFWGHNIVIYGGKRDQGRGIVLGSQCKIYDQCRLHSDNWPGCGILIGDNCHFNYGCYIAGGGGVTIGAHCMFGPGAKVIAMNHNYHDLFSNIIDQGHNMGPVFIHDNVLVGAGAIVLPGVTIESGVVVAAGAVVTKSVARDSVVAGVPARPIFKRGQPGPRCSNTGSLDSANLVRSA